MRNTGRYHRRYGSVLFLRWIWKTSFEFRHKGKYRICFPCRSRNIYQCSPDSSFLSSVIEQTAKKYPVPYGGRNAFYDYVTMERPQSDFQRIFLCERTPCKPISAGTVGNAAGRLYEAASVRQGKQDRKGPIFSGITSQLLFPEMTSPDLWSVPLLDMLIRIHLTIISLRMSHISGTVQ
mgnify:CR=1 FL=1